MINESILGENIEIIRERIEKALVRAGREGEEIAIVGVTKTWGPEVVEALVKAGIKDIGENRIQEFLEKEPKVSSKCRWHMVGTLQRNKASKAIGRFHLIQSIDNLRLARTLSRLSVDRGVKTRVLIEMNTSGELSKHGFAPAEAMDVLGQIASLPGIKLEGLMTIGPLTDSSPKIRKAFRKLYMLKEEVNRTLRPGIQILSMGMSDDFELALEEGSTMVRLGRIFLGERLS